MNKKEKLFNEIRETLKNSPIGEDPVHADLTLKYVLELKPDADDALQISAFGHDIDRAVNKITDVWNLKNYNKIDEFKKEHSIRSAKIMKELLNKYDFDKEIIDKVVTLVENHEFGGDKDTNILVDADSIAYFDYNVFRYMKRNGAEKTEHKVKFMYNRVSDKAKRIIRSLDYKKDPKVEEMIQKVCK